MRKSKRKKKNSGNEKSAHRPETESVQPDRLNRLETQLQHVHKQLAAQLHALDDSVKRNARTTIFFSRFFYCFAKPFRMLRWVISPIKGLKVLKDAYHIKKSGRFDPDFYLAAYLDVYARAYNPLLHYCAHGWKKRYNPARFFNTAVYLQKNPDVLAAGINPFMHYLKHGQYETFRSKEIGPPATQQQQQQQQQQPGPNNQPLLTRLRFTPPSTTLTDDEIADIRQNIQKGLYV